MCSSVTMTSSGALLTSDSMLEQVCGRVALVPPVTNNVKILQRRPRGPKVVSRGTCVAFKRALEMSRYLLKTLLGMFLHLESLKYL